MAKMCPKDATGIVWALGECFLRLLHFFLTITCILQHVIYKIRDIVEVEAAGGKNGPKQHDWHHLGHR